MRVSKIKIKNLYGIREMDLDGKSIELSGNNGTGKSSLLDSIRSALTNKGQRSITVRQGADDGEIILETDSGLSVGRKFREGKPNLSKIKNDGKNVLQPEAYLREVFSELQIDPISFINSSTQEQNRIILDLIEFEWDTNYIQEKFGELPPKVDYTANILEVLGQIQSEKGHYFTTRQDINRRIRNDKDHIEAIRITIPADFEVREVSKYSLADNYKILEAITTRNALIDTAIEKNSNYSNELAKHAAIKDSDIKEMESLINHRESTIDKRIIDLEHEIEKLKTEKLDLKARKDSRTKLIESEHKAKIAELSAEIRQFEAISKEAKKDTTSLVKELENAEILKGHLNEYRRMEDMKNVVKELTEKSEALTAKIELARSLPAEILEQSKLPIDSLTIKDGIPYLHGKPVVNLSDGEKLVLAVEVAVARDKNIQLILLDRAECLSDVNRKKLYNKCREAGCQIIACRTSNENELTITELGDKEAVEEIEEI